MRKEVSILALAFIMAVGGIAAADTSFPFLTASTIGPYGTVVQNSGGCAYKDIACPSNYQYCVFQVSGATGVSFGKVINCNMQITLGNPNVIQSGKPMCDPFYGASTQATLANCLTVGFNPPAPSGGTPSVVFQGTAFYYYELKCPTNYAYCIVSTPSMSSYYCGPITKKTVQLPLTLGPGQLFCGTDGQDLIVNTYATVTGYSFVTIAPPALTNLQSIIQSLFAGLLNFIQSLFR
jgi:hypothetical protein